jgi:hypothetical protein
MATNENEVRTIVQNVERILEETGHSAIPQILSGVTIIPEAERVVIEKAIVDWAVRLMRQPGMFINSDRDSIILSEKGLEIATAFKEYVALGLPNPWETNLSERAIENFRHLSAQGKLIQMKSEFAFPPPHVIPLPNKEMSVSDHEVGTRNGMLRDLDPPRLYNIPKEGSEDRVEYHFGPRAFTVSDSRRQMFASHLSEARCDDRYLVLNEHGKLVKNGKEWRDTSKYAKRLNNKRKGSRVKTVFPRRNPVRKWGEVESIYANPYRYTKRRFSGKVVIDGQTGGYAITENRLIHRVTFQDHLQAPSGSMRKKAKYRSRIVNTFWTHNPYARVVKAILDLEASPGYTARHAEIVKQLEAAKPTRSKEPK